MTITNMPEVQNSTKQADIRSSAFIQTMFSRCTAIQVRVMVFLPLMLQQYPIPFIPHINNESRFNPACALILCLQLNIIQAQYSITGIVRDHETGERLIGANILDEATKTGTVTDNNGHFVLILKEPATLSVSFVGYITQTIAIENRRDTLLQITLYSGHTLGEIVVKADPFRRTDIIRVDNDLLQRTPNLEWETGRN
jgi:hypothetical protein